MTLQCGCSVFFRYTTVTTNCVIEKVTHDQKMYKLLIRQITQMRKRWDMEKCTTIQLILFLGTKHNVLEDTTHNTTVLKPFTVFRTFSLKTHTGSLKVSSV